MWLFKNMNAPQKRKARQLYANADYNGLDALFKEARVYPPATHCPACERNNQIALWMDWAISKKIL